MGRGTPGQTAGKAVAPQRQQPHKEKQLCTGKESRPPAVPVARRARKGPGLLSFSRETWLSSMQRVDLPWNKAVGRHGGTTDPPGELAWSPSLVPLAVGTGVRHNRRQDSVNTLHSQLGMVPDIISDSKERKAYSLHLRKAALEWKLAAGGG